MDKGENFCKKLKDVEQGIITIKSVTEKKFLIKYHNTDQKLKYGIYRIQNMQNIQTNTQLRDLTERNKIIGYCNSYGVTSIVTAILNLYI